MQYDLGPGGFPKFACTAMILLALITIIKELRGRGNEKLNLINTKTLLHFGLITLYVILLPYLGFVLNSLWVMPSMMVIMGASKPVKIILISASFITFLYIIFAYLLKVPLPLGVLEPIFR
jgi:hypothetical protein